MSVLFPLLLNNMYNIYEYTSLMNMAYLYSSYKNFLLQKDIFSSLDSVKMVYFLDLVLVVGNIGQDGKWLHFYDPVFYHYLCFQGAISYKLGYFCNQGPGTMIYSASKLQSPEVTAKLRPRCHWAPPAEMNPICWEQPSRPGCNSIGWETPLSEGQPGTTVGEPAFVPPGFVKKHQHDGLA